MFSKTCRDPKKTALPEIKGISLFHNDGHTNICCKVINQWRSINSISTYKEDLL
jgi:hypothetical protein